VGFLKGNIIKYSLRAGHKAGSSNQADADKARHYQQKLKEFYAAEDLERFTTFKSWSNHGPE
jgi:hypothetical protein